MRLATLVFARMDSQRLPGKSLADVCGKPLLHYVVARAKRAKHKVIVATSDRPIDDPIVRFAVDENVGCFRGSADNVAGRALACAQQNKLDAIVRISGDSPFIDPDLIDAMTRDFAGRPTDVLTNTFPRTYPSGQSVEVVSRAALELVNAKTSEAGDLEHVTRYIYANPGLFNIRSYDAAEKRDLALTLTVDEPDDLARTRWMISEGAGPEAPLATVMNLAARYRTQHAT